MGHVFEARVAAVLLLWVIVVAVRRASRRDDMRRWSEATRVATGWVGVGADELPAATVWCRLVAPVAVSVNDVGEEDHNVEHRRRRIEAA